MRNDRRDGPVTAEDVAKRAGVSRSAVSRTFTEGASVAPATREKVLEAARDLGYRVNFLARSLSHRRTDLVGLVVSDLDHSLRADLIDKLARRLVALNYRPFLLPTMPGEDVSRLIDMMLHYNVAGAIVTSDTPPAEIAHECAAYRVPLVLVNKPDVGPHVANITMDSAKAGLLAAEALQSCGCHTIAIASQKRPSYTIALRKRAFLQQAEALGLTVIGDFQGEAQNYEGGTRAGEAFVESGAEPDGVFCVNDYMALGFVDRLRRRGCRIPEDLKLVSCDDIAEAAWGAYDLTTVRQDTATLAGATVDALLERIEKPDEASSGLTVDVELVWRGSAGPRPRHH